MLRKIPRFRPSVSWKTIGSIVGAACRVPSEGAGPCVFEEALARYLGVRHALPVSSGRAGLRMILKNAGHKAGDEVILSAFNYWAIPGVVEALGLRPVFVDIDPLTCNLDAGLIEKKITKQTRAVVATHLYGLACDMDAVLQAAAGHDLFVIEDCVQALGATCQDRRTGSLGAASYFSFGLTKTLPLLGGGIVACNDDALAGRIRADVASCVPLGRAEILKRAAVAATVKTITSPWLFDFLLFPFIYMAGRRDWDLIGDLFNERPSGAPPAGLGPLRGLPVRLREESGCAALDDLGALIKKRVDNGRYLQQHLRTRGRMVLPPVSAGNVFTSFPVRVKDRRDLWWKLLMRGIDTSKGFMQAFGDDCPNAERLEDEILHLPVHPFLRERDLEYLCGAVNAILEEGGTDED